MIAKCMILLLIYILSSMFTSCSIENNYPGFDLLEKKTISIDGQTNIVNIYRHKNTGLKFVMVSGNNKIKSFLLCQTEVTQGIWIKIMGTTPWRDQKNVKEGDDYPATYISWEDSSAFCKKTGLRLPADYEWEYAFAGSILDFFIIKPFVDNLNKLYDYAWYYKNIDELGERYAHRVGGKKPNSLGLYDMLGNVSEWCQDIPVQDIPIHSIHFSLGGSWGSNASHYQLTKTGLEVPDDCNCFTGFRPAFSCE